jgi:DNA repair exonuclease SbcCD ATPase subunit
VDTSVGDDAHANESALPARLQQVRRRRKSLKSMSLIVDAVAARAADFDERLDAYETAVTERLEQLASILVFDLGDVRRTLESLAPKVEDNAVLLQRLTEELKGVGERNDAIKKRVEPLEQAVLRIGERHADVERAVDAIATHNGFICEWVGAIHDHLDSIDAELDGPLSEAPAAELSDDDINVLLEELETPTARV